MTYACLALEFAADTNLMELQHLQNKILRIISKFPRNTPIRDIHKSIQISYAYNYITKLCRHTTKSFTITRMYIIAILDRRAGYRKYKRLKLGGGQTCDVF
jgi:hypothetical protein